jgi:hypothetical protein
MPQLLAKLKDYWIYPILFLHFLLLLSGASELSISTKEARLFFDECNIARFAGLLPTYILGQSDIALRINSIILIIASSWLNYQISKKYLKYESDVFISVLIFTLLAGINSAGLTYNISSFVIFFTYLFLYFYIIKDKYPYYHLYILTLMLFIDGAFISLYLALFLYSIRKKDNLLKIISLVLFILSYLFYDFAVDGTPRSYFLDTFGQFAGVFSPFLFLYIIYAIYRLGIIRQKEIIWYIATTSLVLSLFLSLRQKIDIVYFAPFLIVSIPIVLRLFLNGYRVRLRQFRTKYRIMALLIVFGLLSNASMIFFNKYMFLLEGSYEKNFAYRNYFAKELAHKLHELNIKAVKCEDDRLQLRLQFYGIGYSNQIILSQHKAKSFQAPFQTITINYYGKDIVSYYLYKHQKPKLDTKDEMPNL